MSIINIGFTAANPDAQGEAVVYVGQAASLTLTLTNDSESPVPLSTGASASALTLFPPRFYTSEQVQQMKVSSTDWTAQLAGRGWVLTYAGTDQQWAAGASIVIHVANALTTAQPTSGFLQILIKNMGPSAPVSVNANLSLNNPPEPGNADLSKTLAVSLNNQGTVYVSNTGDPLPNTLFLNLKNIGDKAIYTGDPKDIGSPQINVSFVYGNTAGALAANDDPHVDPKGSAWNIAAGLQVTNEWRAFNPTYSDEQPNPVWTLKPTDTNFTIIGTGDQANVTFWFANIVSFTPPGHTQMIVQCIGFKQTAQRLYNDYTFVIDISKQVAPPTRGLVNFFGDKPLATVYDPTTTTDVSLQWAMFDVPYVMLVSNIPHFNPLRIDYPKFTPLAYDNKTITIPGVSQNTLTFFTIQSFDANDNYLNSLQFASFIQALMFVDPRDGQVYGAILAGRTLWMAQNLNYASPQSSYYNDDPSNAGRYGRLYSWDDANNKPAGWRLPSDSDWNALISAYGSGSAAYNALIAGGSSGFNAQLGGVRDDAGDYTDLTNYGYYWGADQGLGKVKKSTYDSHNYAQFSKDTSSVTTGAAYPDDFRISVRYVRDIV